LGEQDFFLFSLLSWGLFHHTLSWLWLFNICFAGTINWKHFLDLYSSSINLQENLTVTYKGVPSDLGLFPYNPLWVTQEASILLDFSITKTRGVYVEVIAIGVPSCVTGLLFGLGFSLTTNHAIKVLTPFSGRILDHFQSLNDTWKSFPKSFIQIFPRDSTEGIFPHDFDELHTSLLDTSFKEDTLFKF
jgi:hypothetical protein